MENSSSHGASSYGASSYDVSSMGSREQSEMADSTFSLEGGLGASGVGKSWVADKAVLYLSGTGHWAFESSWKLQGIFFLYHHVFLALYALHPLWGHAFSYDNSVARMVMRLLGHGWAMVAEDESILVALLVMAVTLTVLHACLAVHLAWTLRAKKSPFVGEKVIVRIFEVFYIKLLGLPALGVMLSPLTCQWGSTSPAGVSDPSLMLGETTCAGSLATLGAVGAIIAIAVHVPLYLGCTIKECEANPLTDVPLQAGSAPGAFRIEVLKISSLFVVHLLAGISKVAAGFLNTSIWVWIVYIAIQRLPYVGHWHSVARAAIAGAIMWMAAAATAQADGHDAELALSVGGVLVGLFSGALALRRVRAELKVLAMYYAVRSEIAPASRKYHRFHDQEEAELLVRVLRRNMKQTTVSQEDKDGVIAGLTQASHIFGDAGEVSYAQAVVNTFLLGDGHTATSLLQKAKGVKTSLPMKIAILLLEKIVRKKHNIEKGDSMDWATYVELQDNMRLLLNTHKKAIKSANEVWRVLLKHDIGVDDIATAIRRMDRFEVVADGAYRSMLERHPNQPRLMTLYGKFLEEVQGNTHAAARYFQEAEKMEEAAENRAEDTEEEPTGGQTNINESRDGVCVMTTEGIMTFANNNLAKMFGYKRNEMIGRSINLLIPPPFAGQHDRFLKSFQTSRQQKMLKTPRTLVAINKEREIFPVFVTASVITQGGQEAFMGVIRKVDEDSRAATLYLTGTGNVISVSKAFTSLSGSGMEDLAGRHASSVFPVPGEVTSLIQEALARTEEERRTTGREGTALTMRTRFGEDVTVTITCQVGGTPDYPIVMATVTAKGQETPALVMSAASGEVLHCNVALETALGAAASSLIGSNVLDLLTEPYRTFFRETALSAGAGSYHGSRRFSPSVFHGRVVQLAAKGSKGFRAVAATRDVESSQPDANLLSVLTLVPLQSGAVPANLELVVDDGGAIVDAEIREGPLHAPKDSLVGHAISQVLHLDGDPQAHVTSWKAIPESLAGGIAHPGVPPPAHVTVTLPSGISVPACAMWRRSEGRTHIALLPFESLGVVVEVSPALTINAVHGQTSMLLGQRSDVLRGKPLRDILPGMQAAAGDIPSLLAAGGRRGGAMKKKLSASVQIPGVELASTLGQLRATVQTVARSSQKIAWVVIAPDASSAPAPLPEPVCLPTGASKHGMSPGSEREEIDKDGGTEKEEEKEGSQEKEKEGSGEEKGEGTSQAESGREEGGEGHSDGDERNEHHNPSSDWMAQRVEEWVTHGGVVSSTAPIDGLGEPAALVPEAVRKLERGMSGDGSGNTESAAGALRQAHGSVRPSSQDVNMTTSDVEVAGRGPVDSLALAGRVKGSSGSAARGKGSDAGESPAVRRVPAPAVVGQPSRPSRLGVASGLAPTMGPEGKGKGSEEESEEMEKAAKGKGGSSEEGTDENTGGGSVEKRDEDDTGGDIENRGDGTGADRGGGRNDGGEGTGKMMTEDALEKLAGMSTGSGTSVGEGNNFGVVAGIGRDVDDDLVDLLGGETVQARVKRFKRILGLMSAPLMLRPLQMLKYYIWALSAVITAVHCTGFGILMMYISRHSMLLSWVDQAGLSLVNIPQVVIHTRIMQAQSIGTSIPGYPTFDFNRERLDLEIRDFMDGHSALYETQSAFGGSWHDMMKDVWLSDDLPVLRPTADDMTYGELVEEHGNLWEVGNRFIAHGLDLAQFTEERVAEIGDIALTGAYSFMVNNGIDVLLPQYRLLRDSLFQITVENLQLIGTLAIVFLVIEGAVVLPVALFLLNRQLRRVLMVRINQMALLLAVPRSLANELWKRPVHLDGQEEEEQDEEEVGFGAGKRVSSKQSAASSKTIRALLSQKIGYDRVTVGAALLQKQHQRMRGHRMLQLRVMGPLLLWATIAAVLFGITYLLQADTATRLEPIKASHILLTLRSSSQEAAVRLLMRAENKRQGRVGTRTDLEGPRADLIRASREMLKAAFSLVYGTPDLLDLYEIPKGTAFRVQALLPLFFEEGCYASDPSDCLDEADPEYPILQSGFAPLLMAFSADAEMLSLDYEEQLTRDNHNFTFIMETGNGIMRNIQEEVHATLVSYLGDMWALQAIHIVLLVLTLLMCAGYVLVALRPIRQLVLMEGTRLSMLIAQLPKELAVEEAIVAMLAAMSTRSDDEEKLLEDEGEQNTGENAKGPESVN